MGSYVNLYRKFLWFFILDTMYGSSKTNSFDRQMNEWKKQYNIPDELVIREDI